MASVRDREVPGGDAPAEAIAQFGAAVRSMLAR
jgi:hypothetical protein